MNPLQKLFSHIVITHETMISILKPFFFAFFRG